MNFHKRSKKNKMADKTKIEWTDSTWNVITGCSPISPGCANCYAAQLAGTRLKNHPSRKGLTKEVNGKPAWTGEVRFNEEWLTLPLRWKKPRRIFVCAHGDLFHENVPDEWLDKIFAVMVLAHQHTFQLLTKRPKRMQAYIQDMAAGNRQEAMSRHSFYVNRSVLGVACEMRAGVEGGILRNVWLGVTAENQEQANKRIPLLLETPAAKRFVSIEPMLGPVNFLLTLKKSDAPERGKPDLGMHALRGIPGVLKGLDWVICGGESGPNARPMHPDWVRSLRNQCQDAGVPFFFKQWGEWRPPEDGEEYDTSMGRAQKIPAFIVSKSGTVSCFKKPGTKHSDAVMLRVGKKAAGRLLDGKEYLEVPE